MSAFSAAFLFHLLVLVLLTFSLPAWQPCPPDAFCENPQLDHAAHMLAILFGLVTLILMALTMVLWAVPLPKTAAFIAVIGGVIVVFGLIAFLRFFLWPLGFVWVLQSGTGLLWIGFLVTLFVARKGNHQNQQASS